MGLVSVLLTERYEADSTMLLAAGDSWYTGHSYLQASTSVRVSYVFGMSEGIL